MRDARTTLEKFSSRIRNNKVVAILIFIGTVVIGVSTFTNAARNLAGLVSVDSRAEINGEWNADVTYDWPNAKYKETFTLTGSGDEVQGAASFLGVKRGILDGMIKGRRVEFTIKTRETAGDSARDVEHHYTATLMDEEIHFVMQTDGSLTAHVPVEFVARRAAGAPQKSK